MLWDYVFFAFIVMMYGVLVLWVWFQWGESVWCEFYCNYVCFCGWKFIFIYLIYLVQVLCCCDLVVMENLYIFGFFVVFIGRIIEENVFVVRKYKYY